MFKNSLKSGVCRKFKNRHKKNKLNNLKTLQKMKATETLIYENKVFTILVETFENDDTKAHVDYFIDGIQVTDWSKVVKRYQRLLTGLADNLCEGYCLVKWSY